jgi:hypothetical protein
MSRVLSGLFLALLACASEEVPSPASTNPGPSLGFAVASVLRATEVDLSEFTGPSLDLLTDPGCLEADRVSLRILQVRRDGVIAGAQPLLELVDGVWEGPLEGARSQLDAALEPRAAAARSLAERECGLGFGYAQAQRILLAVEAEMPRATVQMVLQSLLSAGFIQPVFLVESESSLRRPSWSREDKPAVLSAPEVPLDPSAVGRRGLVGLSDSTWDQSLRRHSGLAELGVGCVSYVWGSNDDGVRLSRSSEAQGIGDAGRVSVLALAPLQVSQGESQATPQELVTGARCGDWGHFGPAGDRPSGEI